MTRWSTRRMSNSAAAWASRSVSTLSCGLGGARGVVVDENQAGGQQFKSPFDDQAVIHDRTVYAALAYALAFEDAVGAGEVEHPALFVREVFELRTEKPHHVVAARDRHCLLGLCGGNPSSEFGGRQQQPGALQPQTAHHAQAREFFGGQAGQRSARCRKQGFGRPEVVGQQCKQFVVVERPGAARRQFVMQVFHVRGVGL